MMSFHMPDSTAQLVHRSMKVLPGCRAHLHMQSMDVDHNTLPWRDVNRTHPHLIHEDPHQKRGGVTKAILTDMLHLSSHFKLCLLRLSLCGCWLHPVLAAAPAAAFQILLALNFVLCSPGQRVATVHRSTALAHALISLDKAPQLPQGSLLSALATPVVDDLSFMLSFTLLLHPAVLLPRNLQKARALPAFLKQLVGDMQGECDTAMGRQRTAAKLKSVKATLKVCSRKHNVPLSWSPH